MRTHPHDGWLDAALDAENRQALDTAYTQWSLISMALGRLVLSATHGEDLEWAKASCLQMADAAMLLADILWPAEMRHGRGKRLA